MLYCFLGLGHSFEALDSALHSFVVFPFAWQLVIPLIIIIPMLPVRLLFPAFLLSDGIGEVAALALFGRQQAQSNATLGLDKRQRADPVTRFSTIFLDGDPSKTRTANEGFDCRVDLVNGLWGFCPTSVASASDCGLAGICVDSFSCSKGCGSVGSPLTTFTCADAKAPFCSTALLALASNVVGPFTYLACGGSPKTDEYKAFTTSASPSPTSNPTPSSTSSIPKETASTPKSTGTGSITPKPNPESTSLGSSSSPLPQKTSTNPSTSLTTADTNAPTPNTPSNLNLGALIGGVVGCVALICLCIVAIVFIRRKRNAAAAVTGAAEDSKKLGKEKPSESQSALWYKPELGTSVQKVELAANGPAAYDASNEIGHGAAQWGRRYPPQTPVELPASWGWAGRS